MEFKSFYTDDGLKVYSPKHGGNMLDGVVSEKNLFSQKARGLIRLLQHRHGDTLPTAFIPGGSHRPVIYGEMEKFFKEHPHPVLFVRPCPENPNHGGEVAGFQSEPVAKEKSILHVWKVRQAIAKKDLNADIVVMPYVESDISSVAAPGKYYVWGLGNNGVTAGTSKTVVIPINPSQHGHNFLLGAGYDPGQVEIEFIRDKKTKKVYCVQIRGASAHLDIDPAPEGAIPGFVPTGKMTVAKTYTVKDLNDLGELEFLKSTDTEGLLVIQPTGSMLSHAAAHCRGAKIAFCIGSPAIKAGDIVAEPASGWLVVGDVEAKPYNPATYFQHFRRGFFAPMVWADMKLGTFFHQWATKPLGAPDQVAYLGGRYCKWLVQAGVTAFCGESRHTYRVMSNGDWGGDAIRNHYIKMTGEPSPQRSSILNTLKESAVTMDDLLRVAVWTEMMFRLPWSGSYGGPKWRVCATNAVKAIRLIQEGTNVDAAITALNDLENGVHNGGRLFNKFKESLAWLDRATAAIGMGVDDAPVAAEIAAHALLTKFDDTPVSESHHHWKTTALLHDVVIPKMGKPGYVSSGPSVEMPKKSTDELLGQVYEAVQEMHGGKPKQKSAMTLRPNKGL